VQDCSHHTKDFRSGIGDPGHLIGRQDESEQFGPAIRLNMRNDQDRGGCIPDIADKLDRAELNVRSCINCFISEVHEVKNWFHTLPLPVLPSHSLKGGKV
jgi:hypothetical protein